jgi:hypothetical protein
VYAPWRRGSREGVSSLDRTGEMNVTLGTSSVGHSEAGAVRP